VCILLGFYDRFDRRRIDQLMQLGVKYEFQIAEKEKRIIKLEKELDSLVKDYNNYIDLTSKSMEKIEAKMVESMRNEALTDFLLNHEPYGEA
jgi:hypothetical protein